MSTYSRSWVSTKSESALFSLSRLLHLGGHPDSPPSSARSVTKLPPLCSPLLPERSVSLTIGPRPAPICLSTLDGTRLGSWESPPSFQYHLGSQWDSSRCARWGPCCLHPLSPFNWRPWWSVPVLPAMNAYSSLFSVVFPVFPLVISAEILLPSPIPNHQNGRCQAFGRFRISFDSQVSDNAPSSCRRRGSANAEVWP